MIVLLFVIALACPTLVAGQPSEGTVDLRADIEEQIDRIESRLENTDMRANRQVIMLR